MSQSSINEVVHLSVQGRIFTVRVLEDFIEIIDSGPRYDINDNLSHSSLGSDNHGFNGGTNVSSEDGSFIPDSFQPLLPGDSPIGHRNESLAALGRVNAFNACADSSPPTQAGDTMQGFLVEPTAELGVVNSLIATHAHAPKSTPILSSGHSILVAKPISPTTSAGPPETESLAQPIGILGPLSSGPFLPKPSIPDIQSVLHSDKLRIQTPSSPGPSKGKSMRGSNQAALSLSDLRVFSRGLSGHISLHHAKRAARLKAHPPAARGTNNRRSQSMPAPSTSLSMKFRVLWLLCHSCAAPNRAPMFSLPHIDLMIIDRLGRSLASAFLQRSQKLALLRRLQVIRPIINELSFLEHKRVWRRC